MNSWRGYDGWAQDLDYLDGEKTQKRESMALDLCVACIACEIMLLLQVLTFGGCLGYPKTVPQLSSLRGRDGVTDQEGA